MSHLRATGLSKSFGLTHALRGVEVDIAPGETVAVVGPSGSGKSTLLHLLAGVLQPDRGEVHFGDHNLTAMSAAERGKLRLTTFGFVFQFGQLLPDLSAVDNVAIPLLLAGKRRSVALARARELLDRLGLTEHLHKRPTQLSGGQSQRVAVARALALGPQVVFADEPTGSLDSLAAEQTMDLLTDVVRHLGATLIVVTHDPRTAAYADREITVRDGRISADAGTLRTPA
ncbi:MAG: ABC transporter ATP-binding protein [Propionibacteriaceae bacterium]|nr:ABC transporter ATP-binding protein [Propionibacteriaceae bacterium]